MKKLIMLLMFILVLPNVMAQTLDYNFFVNNGEVLSVDSGLLYLHIPNETLEKSTVVAGAMFFPKPGFQGDLVLSDKDGLIDKEFFTFDDAPGNKSYLIFEWPIHATESTNLDFSIQSKGQIDYKKTFHLNVKKRKLLNKDVVEKTIPLNIKMPENVFELREKMSEKGFDLTEKEFSQMIENAKTVDLTKEIEKEVLTYEGDLVITKTRTTFNLKNLKNDNLYIIEHINKSIAENVSLINFSSQPIVLENDPLIMWHIENSNVDEISYEMETNGSVDEGLTGNTILLAGVVNKKNKNNIKNILMPLILIPLVVLIIIYFGTINIRKKK